MTDPTEKLRALMGDIETLTRGEALALSSVIHLRLMDLATDELDEVRQVEVATKLGAGNRLRFTIDTMPYRVRAELVDDYESTDEVFRVEHTGQVRH